MVTKLFSAFKGSTRSAQFVGGSHLVVRGQCEEERDTYDTGVCIPQNAEARWR